MDPIFGIIALVVLFLGITHMVSRPASCIKKDEDVPDGRMYIDQDQILALKKRGFSIEEIEMSIKKLGREL